MLDIRQRNPTIQDDNIKIAALRRAQAARAAVARAELKLKQLREKEIRLNLKHQREREHFAALYDTCFGAEDLEIWKEEEINTDQFSREISDLSPKTIHLNTHKDEAFKSKPTPESRDLVESTAGYKDQDRKQRQWLWNNDDVDSKAVIDKPAQISEKPESGKVDRKDALEKTLEGHENKLTDSKKGVRRSSEVYEDNLGDYDKKITHRRIYSVSVFDDSLNEPLDYQPTGLRCTDLMHSSPDSFKHVASPQYADELFENQLVPLADEEVLHSNIDSSIEVIHEEKYYDVKVSNNSDELECTGDVNETVLDVSELFKSTKEVHSLFVPGGGHELEREGTSIEDRILGESKLLVDTNELIGVSDKENMSDITDTDKEVTAQTLLDVEEIMRGTHNKNINDLETVEFDNARSTEYDNATGCELVIKERTSVEDKVPEDDTMVVDEHQDSSTDSASDSLLEYKCEQQSQRESEDREHLDGELQKREEKDSTQDVTDVKVFKVKVNEGKNTTDDLNVTKRTVELCIKDNNRIHEFRDEVIKNKDQDLNCKEFKLKIDNLKDSTNDDNFEGTENDASYSDHNSRSMDIKIKTPVKQNVKLSAFLTEMEYDDLREFSKDDDEVVMNDNDITHYKDCNELKGTSTDGKILDKNDITDSKDKRKHKNTDYTTIRGPIEMINTLKNESNYRLDVERGIKRHLPDLKPVKSLKRSGNKKLKVRFREDAQVWYSEHDGDDDDDDSDDDDDDDDDDEEDDDNHNATDDIDNRNDDDIDGDGNNCDDHASEDDGRYVGGGKDKCATDGNGRSILDGDDDNDITEVPDVRLLIVPLLSRSVLS